MFFPQSLDPNLQNSLLDFPRDPRCPQAKINSRKWGLTLTGVEGVNLVFQRLHGVVDILLGLFTGKLLPLVRSNPLLCIRHVLFVVNLRVRFQELVNPVGRTAPVLEGGNVSDDLGHLGRRSLNGAGRGNPSISDLKAVLEHLVEID